MIIISKSEWFEMDLPIGEPWYDWKKFEGASRRYQIERVVKKDGKIIWLGLTTNWVKEKGGEWTVLTTDETVKPIEEGGCVYPPERQYFKPCEEPIYET